MTYAKITAVLRCAELDGVESRLRQVGLPSFTVTYMPGYDDDADPNHDAWMSRCAVVEIFAASDDVDRIVGVIALWSTSYVVAVTAIDEFGAQTVDRIAG